MEFLPQCSVETVLMACSEVTEKETKKCSLTTIEARKSSGLLSQLYKGQGGSC